MPSVIVSTIDISADSYLDTNSRTRYADYPTSMVCSTQLPIFDDCKCNDTYCHPFLSNSELSLQFIIGNYELADFTSAKVQLLDLQDNILREIDYFTFVSDIDVVDSNFSYDKGARLSLIFKPSNIDVNCFKVRGLFTASDNDIVLVTQTFCRAHCKTLLKIESTYREMDCLGAYYDGHYKNTLYLDAELELTDFQLSEASYNIKGDKIYSKNRDIYSLKSIVNESTAKMLANILKGTQIKINNKSYFCQSIFSKNNDRNAAWVIDVDFYLECESDINLCN